MNTSTGTLKDPNTMNRMEIALAVQKKTGIHKDDVLLIQDETFKVIRAALEKEMKVFIINFGFFYIRIKPPRFSSNFGVSRKNPPKIFVGPRKIILFHPFNNFNLNNEMSKGTRSAKKRNYTIPPAIENLHKDKLIHGLKT